MTQAAAQIQSYSIPYGMYDGQSGTEQDFVNQALPWYPVSVIPSVPPAHSLAFWRLMPTIVVVPHR